MVGALRRAFPGALGAWLTKQDDGSWLDIILWRSRDDAEDAARRIHEIPEAQAWFRHIAERRSPARRGRGRRAVRAAMTSQSGSSTPATSSVRGGAQWLVLIAGNLLAGLIYAVLGALAGVAIGSLGVTCPMLLGGMLDLDVTQNPMFGSGAPARLGRGAPGFELACRHPGGRR
jgi:hypothetical protein